MFITGALGFIGRRLAMRDREAGSQVAGVDVRSDPALDVVAGDITASGAWQQAARGADVVIHTAARMRRSEAWLRTEGLLEPRRRA